MSQDLQKQMDPEAESYGGVNVLSEGRKASAKVLWHESMEC